MPDRKQLQFIVLLPDVEPYALDALRNVQGLSRVLRPLDQAPVDVAFERKRYHGTVET